MNSYREDPVPPKQGPRPVLDMLLCISLGSTEEPAAAMESILFITLCYCYLLFSLKIPERWGEAGGSTSLVLPSIYHGMHGVLPEHVCLLPNSLKLQFTSKCHCHLILSQMPFLPCPPGDANCEPHVSASSVSPHVSDPKALRPCYPRTVWRSRVPAPAQPCLDAIQGLWAAAGWHPCMELGHGESCSVGLDSDSCWIPPESHCSSQLVC